MPRLKNEQWEIFCQNYHATGNQRIAAEAAGYKVADQSGWNLMQKDKIKARLAELRKKDDKKRDKLREKVIAKLEEILEKSKRDMDKLKAIEIINKMFGFNEPEKHEHDIQSTSVVININKKKPNEIIEADVVTKAIENES